MIDTTDVGSVTVRPAFMLGYKILRGGKLYRVTYWRNPHNDPVCIGIVAKSLEANGPIVWTPISVIAGDEPVPVGENLTTLEDAMEALLLTYLAKLTR